MSQYKCFMVEKADWATLYARRYNFKEHCPVGGGIHEVMCRVPNYFPVTWSKFNESDETESSHWNVDIGTDLLPSEFWTPRCQCGYEFKEDEKQVFKEMMYASLEAAPKLRDLAKIAKINGLIVEFSEPIEFPEGQWWPRMDLPPGAMYWQDWMPKNFYWDNKEDLHLEVMVPGKTSWNIDSRCSNCTLKDDRTHRCWVRTGEPPNITVGKGGVTCAAGAGSIAAPKYHGMLQDGYLNSLPDSLL